MGNFSERQWGISVSAMSTELELLSAPDLDVLHRKLIDDFRSVTGVQKHRHKWLAPLNLSKWPRRQTGIF